MTVFGSPSGYGGEVTDLGMLCFAACRAQPLHLQFSSLHVFERDSRGKRHLSSRVAGCMIHAKADGPRVIDEERSLNNLHLGKVGKVVCVGPVLGLGTALQPGCTAWLDVCSRFFHRKQIWLGNFSQRWSPVKG